MALPRPGCARAAAVLLMCLMGLSLATPVFAERQDPGRMGNLMATIHGLVDLFPKYRNDASDFRHLEHAMRQLLQVMEPNGKGKGCKGREGAMGRGMNLARTGNQSRDQQGQSSSGKNSKAARGCMSGGLKLAQGGKIGKGRETSSESSGKVASKGSSKAGGTGGAIKNQAGKGQAGKGQSGNGLAKSQAGKGRGSIGKGMQTAGRLGKCDRNTQAKESAGSEMKQSAGRGQLQAGAKCQAGKKLAQKSDSQPGKSVGRAKNAKAGQAQGNKQNAAQGKKGRDQFAAVGSRAGKNPQATGKNGARVGTQGKQVGGMMDRVGMAKGKSGGNQPRIAPKSADAKMAAQGGQAGKGASQQARMQQFNPGRAQFVGFNGGRNPQQPANAKGRKK